MIRLFMQKEEAELIAKEHGIYIPPFKLAKISGNAAKILNLFSKNDPAITYQEILLTLDVVKKIIEQKGGKINDDNKGQS